MMRPFFLLSNRGGKGLLVIGGIFILFGLLVMSHPEILVGLIASLFIFLGLLLFSWGLSFYQTSKRNKTETFIDYEHFWKK